MESDEFSSGDSPCIMFRMDAYKELDKIQKRKELLEKELCISESRISQIQNRLRIPDQNLVSFFYNYNEAFGMVEGWKCRLKVLMDSPVSTEEYVLYLIEDRTSSNYIVSSIFKDLAKPSKMESEACLSLGVNYSRKEISKCEYENMNKDEEN